MTASPERDTLISRIRKLQKFTTENGCGEHEASAAAAKVAELIAEYNISSDELRVRADAAGCITDDFTELSGSHSDWMDCATPISRLYSCRVWCTSGFEDPLGIGLRTAVCRLKFFGFPSDVAACIATATLVYNAVTTEALAQRSHRNSFRAGMIARLCERLREMAAQRQRPAASSTSSALMVLKDQLVTEEYAKLNLRLGRGRSSAARTPANPAAYAAGRAAGSRTDLGGGAKLQPRNRLSYSG